VEANTVARAIPMLEVDLDGHDPMIADPAAEAVVAGGDGAIPSVTDPAFASPPRHVTPTRVAPMASTSTAATTGVARSAAGHDS
jgi:hypothetical protein